jgi:hypothetical protein
MKTVSASSRKTAHLELSARKSNSRVFCVLFGN